MIDSRLRVLLVSAILSGAIAAQSTIPHFSTWFGTAGRDEGVTVLRGPGPLVTLVGHTTGSGLFGAGGLATPGAYQTANANPGTDDVFVARFDPSLPAGSQLLWCTYLGSTGDEFVYDADLDPTTGVVTVVGVTTSPTFPGIAGPLVVSGPNDGFLAQIDDNGMSTPPQLSFSMVYGGSGEDHICELEFVDRGAALVAIAGVTSSQNLLAATNPYRGGVSDAFVARVVLAGGGVPVWSTYLGDNRSDGWLYSTLFLTTPPSWVGNLDKMGMTLDASGNAVVAAASFAGTGFPGPTAGTPCPLQATNAGSFDILFAVTDANGSVTYASFFGGAGDDLPKVVLPHPASGYLIAGSTSSNGLPTQPGSSFEPFRQGGLDGLLVWIDPSTCAGQLRYCTYFGGTGGDTIQAMALESSGVATVVGYGGVGLPMTPRCLQGAAGSGQDHGFVARLEPSGRGVADLHYASLVEPVSANASAALRGVALDEVGDVWFAGMTTAAGYPLQTPVMPTKPGGRDAVLTHMPLLPGGVPGVTVTRQHLLCATSCAGVVPYTGMAGAPVPGSTVGFTVTDAPPSSFGVVAFGTRAPTCVPLLNAQLLVGLPPISVLLQSGPHGYARHDFPIPSGFPPIPNFGYGTQWLFLCAGSSLANSERLDW